MGSITATIDTFSLDEITSEIKRTMRRSAKDAVQLGYMLRRVLEERLYLDNYEDFDTYIQQELQMDYTMASRFIKINKKYSFMGKSMDIAQKYEQYSQGLLIEMLNMTPEQEADVTPDTTVRQAREIKKKAKVTDLAKIPAVDRQREEIIIDGDFREIKEPEKVATSQPEETLSAYGLPKTEYEPGSRLTTKGCGHKHDCFMCAMDCRTRDEDRYCVEAPLGNPFPCTVMDELEDIRDEFGEECQFINHELAHRTEGNGEPVPCCKECQVYDCGYRCRKAVNLGLKDTEEEAEKEISPEEVLQTMKIRLNNMLTTPQMFSTRQIEQQKIIVAALASMVTDLQLIAAKEELAKMEAAEQDNAKNTQPELPVLKNNDARKAWLEDYKAWGLWYRDEHIDVNYYKYDFTDGSRLVVAEYPHRFAYWNSEHRDEHYYHLLEKNKKGYKKTYDEQYRDSTDSETYLVEFLKNLQKKG